MLECAAWIWSWLVEQGWPYWERQIGAGGSGSVLCPSWWWCLEASITWLLNWCHNTIYSPSHPVTFHRVAFSFLRLFNKVFGLHKCKTTPWVSSCKWKDCREPLLFLLGAQEGCFYKSQALCTFMHLLIRSCLMLFAMHSAVGQFSVHCLDSAELQWPCIRKYSVCSIQLTVCSKSNQVSQLEPEHSHSRKQLSDL